MQIKAAVSGQMPLFKLFHSHAAAHLATKSIPGSKVSTCLIWVDPFREEFFSSFSTRTH
jgi:hypothetical protein